MNRRHLALLLPCGALTVVLAGASLAATEPLPVPPWSAVQSRITVEGTSNLHEWTVSADGMQAIMDLPAGFLDGQAAATPSGSFSISTKALKSDKDRMNRLMWDALGAQQHPQLSFELRGARVKDRPANAVDVEVEGLLTVAGTARPTTMVLRVQRQGERLTVKGELPLLMSDFGIAPPTALLGTLKTGDRVVVTIEATLAPGS